MKTNVQLLLAAEQKSRHGCEDSQAVGEGSQADDNTAVCRVSRGEALGLQ